VCGKQLVDCYLVGCAGGPKHMNCTEDDDFMVAFDKMMTDTVQARNNESVKVPQLDIAVPMHMRSQKPRCKWPTSRLSGTLVGGLCTRALVLRI